MCICGKVIDGRDKYRTYLSEVATYSLLFRFCDANGLPLFSPSNEVLGVLFHSTGHNPPPRQDIPARKSLALSKASQLQTEMANFHPSKEMKLACQWNGNHRTGGLKSAMFDHPKSTGMWMLRFNSPQAPAEDKMNPEILVENG